MGLDIYLTTVADHEAEQAYERSWEALFNRKNSGELTDEQYQQEREKLGPWPGRDRNTSGTYLRSSYNGGGFNSAVQELAGQDHGYYWVFEPLGREWDGDERGPLTTDDIPALEQAASRAEQVMDEIERSDVLRVVFEAPVASARGVSSQVALMDVRSELRRHNNQMDQFRAGKGHKPFGAYSNRSGLFFLGEPLSILAAIPGEKHGRQGMHLVHRMSQSTLDGYVQAAREAKQMAERAIEWIKRDGAVHMSWSG